MGAKIITGGERLNLNGAYYKPTVLTRINPEMKIWKEEVFGPALPIVSFKTEEEAIKLANDTKFGLGSQIYTKDLDRAKRVAREVKSGGVDINGANRFKTCSPFGGVKNSGMGR